MRPKSAQSYLNNRSWTPCRPWSLGLSLQTENGSTSHCSCNIRARDDAYKTVVKQWDAVFRSIPAFESAVGNQWQAISFDEIHKLNREIYLAPLPDDNINDVTKAALRLLRNTGRAVIRGIRYDKSWMRYASRTFRTTSELISNVFRDELPELLPISQKAEQILSEIEQVARLFSGPPTVDLVKIGSDSLPVLRLKDRLIINLDHKAGRMLVQDALNENAGPASLIGSAARHTYEQLTQVAAVAKSIETEPEVLGPIRRQYIRKLIS